MFLQLILIESFTIQWERQGLSYLTEGSGYEIEFCFGVGLEKSQHNYSLVLPAEEMVKMRNIHYSFYNFYLSCQKNSG